MILFKRNYNNFINEKGIFFKRQEINKKKKLISNNLLNFKNKKKNFIFLLYKNNIDFYLFYLKFLFSKDVVLLLNANINSKYLFNLISTYKPDFLIFPKNKFEKIDNYAKRFSIGSYDFYNCNRYYNHDLNKDLAVLLTTSASTGTKKFVRISYNNIYENTKAIIKYLNIKSTDRLITTLPVDYTYGFSQINTHLMQNAPIIVNNFSIVQKEFWDLLIKSKATSFGGVPFSFEILKKLNFSIKNFSKIKTITQAGGKLSEELQKEFSNYFYKKKISFFIMYGSTEATSRMSYLPPKKSREKLGSVGIPIPGTKIEIMKTKKNEKQGEIIFKGKNVSMGYCESLKDLTKGDLNLGVLHTGDIGFKDKENYIYIVGRKKRFIKVLGHRINLDELEEKIKEKFKSQNILCTGEDNLLNVFSTDKSKFDLIKAYLKKNIKLNDKLFKIILIKKIPKNTSGKILYSKLK